MDLPNRAINISNQVFGDLTAIEPIAVDYYGVIWKCRCVCGQFTNVHKVHLGAGTKSCGCRKRYWQRQAKIKKASQLIGKKFNKLTIIELLERQSSGGNFFYKCLCECGNTVEVDSSPLLCKNPYNATKSCGCLPTGRSGEQNHRWIKDREYLNIKRKLRKFMQHGISGLRIYKNGKSKDILGYTWDILKTHLEAQFDSNMAWSNYGTYWHVDHIVPIDYYLVNNIVDPKIVNALSNLRPLEKIANIKKGNKAISGFAQPTNF